MRARLNKPESDAIVQLLFAQVTNAPQIQCRVRWEPGRLTCWDNRFVQHYAVWEYRPQRRVGERVTIASEHAPTNA